MADGDVVGANERVVRLLRAPDFKNGFVQSTAFDRPEKDRDGLSVSRRGVFSAEDETDLRTLRQVIGAWRQVKASQRLAQISVADILDAGREADRVLSVIEAWVEADYPKPANPAHAIICGLPFMGADEGSLGSVAAADILARKIGPNDVFAAVEPIAA